MTAARTAIANYANAGGSLSVDIDGAGTGTDVITDLLADISTALTTAATAGNTVATDALVKTIATGSLVELKAGTTVTATEKAYNDAIAAIENRQELLDDVDVTVVGSAEALFVANSLGAALRADEALVTTREQLIDAVEAAQAELTEAQEYLAEVNGLYGKLEAAQANVEAAQDAIVDQGFNMGSITAGDDVFVADLSTGGTIAAGFAAGDVLFIGTNYANGGTAATADLSALLSAGSSSVLEVFIEKGAADTVIHIETQPFDSNATGTPDIVTVTLTGVTADLVFENGFVSVA